MTTAKPAGEPRPPRWTIEYGYRIYDAGEYAAEARCPVVAVTMVNALNAAETRAAQPGDAPKLTADALLNAGDALADAAGIVSRSRVDNAIAQWEGVRRDYLDALNALLASRSTPAAPATASTEALIAAGNALDKDATALAEALFEVSSADEIDVTLVHNLRSSANAWRAAVAALHPASATQAAPAPAPPALTADQLAQRFHETYERLAPSFGYETRRDSAVPWESVPEKNRKLMVAVCAELLPAARPGGEGTQG